MSISAQLGPSVEPTGNPNPGGFGGGLGLVDDGSNDLGSYWREMGFVWGHQGTQPGNIRSKLLSMPVLKISLIGILVPTSYDSLGASLGASYYPHPGPSPFYPSTVGRKVALNLVA